MLVDSETGEELPVSVNPQTLTRYTETVLAWADDDEALCRRLGVGYSRFITSVPI